MTISDAHAVFAAEVLETPLTEDDARALMVLFHTHRLFLRQAILDDRPGIMEIEAITQRSVADVVARLWPNRTDLKRTDYRHW